MPKRLPSTAVTLATIAVLGLLAWSNPKMPDYEQYVHQQILKSTDKSSDLEKAAGVLFGGVASHIAANASLRHDFVFFSTYDTKIGSDRYLYLGVLNNFFQVTRGPAKDERNDPAGKDHDD